MKSKRTKKDIDELLAEVKKLLVDLYGDCLVDVILYGSFAKNRATPDSDIDIAVVLRGKVDWSKEIARIVDAIYPLELEHNELISVCPISEEELQNTIWPFYYWIRTEGIRV